MRISLGSDHAGKERREQIIKHLQELGHTVTDYGTYTTDSCDYPDFAYPACLDVKLGKADFAILVCYTGIGMSMCANKVSSIRAALVSSVENAHLTREHNNANVLCLSSKDTNMELSLKIVDEFLSTAFSFGRHERRVNKVMEIEANEK